MAWRASINVECADDTVLGCFTAATPHVSFLLSGVQVCSNVGHCSFSLLVAARVPGQLFYCAVLDVSNKWGVC